MLQTLSDILSYANGTGSVNFYMAHGGSNFGYWAGAPPLLNRVVNLINICTLSYQSKVRLQTELHVKAAKIPPPCWELLDLSKTQLILGTVLIYYIGPHQPRHFFVSLIVI